MERICFLSECFWPENVATSEMLSGVVFRLRALGLPVEVLAGQPTYDGAGRLPQRMNYLGVPIRRVGSTRLDKNSAIGRVLNTATFAVSALGKILLSNGFSRLVVTNVPPIVPWVAALIGQLRHRRYVLVIYDIYPEIAVRLGRLTQGGSIEALWRLLNRWAYERAEAIVVLGECAAEVVRAQMPPRERGKVVVISNWADGDAIKPIPRHRHPLLREWGIEERFVVQYSGNIGLAHDIETVMEAAKILRGGNEHFLFIGKGAQEHRLKDEIRKRNLDNLSLLHFQPRERLPLTLTACDVALVTLKKGLAGLCVPSKFYGILAAGKPVVAVMDEHADIAKAIYRHECGMVVRPGDAEGLAKVIGELERDSGLREQLGERARKAFDENYTIDVIAHKFLKVLGNS